MNVSRGALGALFIAISFISTLNNGLNAEALKAGTIVYLVDPDDHESHSAFAKSGSPVVDSKMMSQDLSLGDDERPPLSQRQSRVAAKVILKEKPLEEKLARFLNAEFDSGDDQALPDFNKSRQALVDMVFKSSTEREFYSRIYMINQLWLDHQDEFARFQSLDAALKEEWVKREEKRKQIREIIIGASALVGAVAGTYISFKTSQKVLPINADEKTLGLFLRWVGRTPIILIGAGVGAAAGAYVGFLGSDYLLYRQFEYLDPIDGDEDLRELLDLIDDLPS